MEASPLTEELFSSDRDGSDSAGEKSLGREIRKSDFINRINYANFENIPLTVIFRHRQFGRRLSLEAMPDPCMGDTLSLQWTGTLPDNEDLTLFSCEKILIPGFGNFLVFFPGEFLITSDGMDLTLPESAFELINRGKTREKATDIDAVLIQNGTMYSGCLRDFHSGGFLVSFDRRQNSHFKLLNREENISLLLSRKGEMVYSGICSIESFRERSGLMEYVVEPLSSSFKRFKGKDYRGERYTLKSPLQVSFTHPLSNRTKQLRVRDLSGSGLSLLESAEKSVLFAGIVIPDLRILLPGSNFLSCKAQVIYTGKTEESKDMLCAGLVILDMNPEEYSRLLDFIHHDLDDRANVCKDVDMKTLWEFFFESGFIYPEKYKYLLANKESIKNLYTKLYTEQPAIARHFIYQEENHIQGHMSMLRSYENTWLLHHHAASTIDSQYSGLHVLNQVGSFTNNCHRIESMHMNYLLCYFRRENKFPNRVFGGLAEKIADKSKCSLDDWGYLHFERNSQPAVENHEDWVLAPATDGEIRDLNCLYDFTSGGLMMEALNLADENSTNRTLLRDYRDSGFSREICLHSVRVNHRTSAMILVDQSDAGLNMSDLTNSFKIFIIDPASLTKSILFRALSELSVSYPGDDKIPTLVFPAEPAADLGINIEKIYTMWVLNMEATDSYFHHLKKLLRNIRH